ncbi:hypothetical protein FDP41_010620 [Naegleria fowleri]|uniref:Glutathione synthetase n=1 Tax=Naegleria fowleri TaxID=5763 RepID=A0A6A5CDW8_NAEFO|nr:uncharacterized protein FDP41_010620 [Naegleria fowleri]KAF0983555.1 hypothetical protein FDP41_010620 [Naegleria fowleri]
MLSNLKNKHALIELAQSWAICNGFILKSQRGASFQSDPIPFTLTPTPIPRKAFDKVVAIAPLLNTLVDRMSRDSEFINQSLTHVAQYDDFVKRLLQIYNETIPNTRSSYQLAIHRSDYMLHVDEKSGQQIPQQVELNTISSAFGALGATTHKLHSYLQKYRTWLASDYYPEAPLQPNPSLENIVNVMQLAHQTFLKSHSHHNESSSHSSLLQTPPQYFILFVVQDGERNIGDQKPYEHMLLEKYGVFVLRRSMKELIGNVQLVQDDAATHQPMLLVEKQHFVSVVYFRSGYTPDDYPTEAEWEVRRMLEACSAIKCPSVGVQLVGTKKIQQIMYEDAVLEKFLSKQEAQSVKEVFTGIYSLEDTQSIEFIRDAFEHPDDYVLKPQREGGGNLVYGETMKNYLDILLHHPNHEQYAAIKYTYILMRKIKPQLHQKDIIRQGQVSSGDCISELGIYGIFLGDGKEELKNTHAGYLLRTKLASFQDGGVASGVASMDSIYLCD